MPSTAPILVIDSGLGGLTVVKSLRSALPYENIVYFGDTARLPYGSKTQSTVTSFIRQIIAYLQPLDPKHVVIACNTATALALPSIKFQFPNLTITGVIEPGAAAAIQAAENKPNPVIGIICTDATARSGAYEAAIRRHNEHARLLVQPAPLLAPIIEDGRNETDPLVQIALSQYLAPLIVQQLDVLVLGCTHYPLLKGLISRMVGPICRVIDSAEQCAQDVARRLRTSGLTLDQLKRPGSLRCFVTDDSPRFQMLASRLLGFQIDRPVKVSPEELSDSSTGILTVPIAS